MLSADVGFRVTGKQPELWDAVSGTMRELPAFVQKGEMTVVPLKLDAYGSAFIVFNKTGQPGSDKLETNFPEPRIVAQLSSPWEVRFDTTMRGPAGTVTMDTLRDWTQDRDSTIRFYSGAAVYRNTFSLTEIPNGQRLLLDLGKVSAMADVKVNGQPAGGVWTAPWQVDITKLVKPGENTLEIEVVNTWANRLDRRQQAAGKEARDLGDGQHVQAERCA